MCIRPRWCLFFLPQISSANVRVSSRFQNASFLLGFGRVMWDVRLVRPMIAAWKV